MSDSICDEVYESTLKHTRIVKNTFLKLSFNNNFYKLIIWFTFVDNTRLETDQP